MALVCRQPSTDLACRHMGGIEQAKLEILDLGGQSTLNEQWAAQGKTAIANLERCRYD